MVTISLLHQIICMLTSSSCNIHSNSKSLHRYFNARWSIYWVLAGVHDVAREIQYFMLDILGNGSLLVSYKLPILSVVKCARIPFPFQRFWFLTFKIFFYWENSHADELVGWIIHTIGSLILWQLYFLWKNIICTLKKKELCRTLEKGSVDFQKLPNESKVPKKE